MRALLRNRWMSNDLTVRHLVPAALRIRTEPIIERSHPLTHPAQTLDQMAILRFG